MHNFEFDLTSNEKGRRGGWGRGEGVWRGVWRGLVSVVTPGNAFINGEIGLNGFIIIILLSKEYENI